MNKILWVIYTCPIEIIILLAMFFIACWVVFGRKMSNKKQWKVFNFIVFLGGVFVVVYITVCSREAGLYEIILIPFQSFAEARQNPEIYRSMLMNVLLFLPIGLSLPNVLPRKWRPSVNVILTVMFALSLSVIVEWCQYRYGLGRCEVDDVIMNTFGAALGASSYRIGRP